jgi:hypothetical protein
VVDFGKALRIVCTVGVLFSATSTQCHVLTFGGARGNDQMQFTSPELWTVKICNNKSGSEKTDSLKSEMSL